MSIKVFGVLLIVLGVVSLFGSILLMVSSDSMLGIALLALSVISNVTGITLASHTPKKKKD